MAETIDAAVNLTEQQPPATALCLCEQYVRVTEGGALTAARWLGRADQDAAEGDAAAAMRAVLDDFPIKGRVVIGSWYGQKRADIDLGGRFHRSRMRLISSQVSTLAPERSGRWSKARRLQVAWWMLEQVRPAHLITHRFPLTQAAQAYAMLDKHPEETLQVILTYEE